MQKPATPSDEIERLGELCALAVLDTLPEERFDRITRTAKTMFAVPIALISLIDHDRQWFKSRQGLAAEQTPRSISFCAHAILNDAVFIIENADVDPRFKDNPLVTAAPFIKFYAGVPLHGPNGYKLGTLCLIDNVPRQLDPSAITALQDLAAWAQAELAADYSSRVAKASESQLFNILGNVVDAIFTVNEADLILAANPAALRMFGYEDKELINNSIKTLMTESYQSKHESFTQNCHRIHVAKLSSKDREMIGKRKDGTPFSVEVILGDMLVLADYQRCFVVIIREISELKLAEKKLRESSHLLKTVMNSTTSYIHVRDLQGRYLYINKEYETVFKCKSEDIIGKSYADILPLELAQKVRLADVMIIETGAALQTETIVQREDGAHIYLVIRSPLLDDDGHVTGTCGVGLDITQNKMLEQEKENALASLRISEERWAYALESSGEAVWDCDVPSGKVQLSERWKEMLGYAENEIGDDVIEWSSRLHPDDMKRVMTGLQDTMEGRSASYSGEYRLLCKNGSYLWILDRSMVVQRDAAGAPLRIVGTQTDISQRKQLEHLKSEFISTVSHELRTPLTSIRGSLGLLEAGVLGVLPPRAMSLIQVANKNSQRLIALVNDLLDMDKLLSGKMMMHSHPVDMAELITQAVEANAAYAASFQVRFTVTVSSSSTVATGDADRLMQVLANLLSNAAKFSIAGDVVDIRLMNANAFLRVEVEDQGEGIPIAFQTRIFQAFAQADSANTRRQGSTGLGLNISKKLIEQMGGEVGYITEINQGTTFWFTLPIAGVR